MNIKWREPVDIRAWFTFFSRWGLKAKLVGIMLALTFTSVLLLFILDSGGVKEIARAVQNQNEDLSQAFQVSMDEITTQGFTNQARLQDFITTLKRKGVKEISILSNERQVVESSNPAKVGKVIPPKHKDFLVTGALGDESGEEGAKRKTYNLVIPVVLRGEQQGYINLKLHLEDIDQLLDSLRARRLIAMVLVFGLGVIGSIFLASRYTDPIGQLVKAARRVAAGDLGDDVTVRTATQGEIGELTRTFNDMVEHLRENQVLQQKLARSEHLSRLGQLSAGIAHEVRNPLNYLSLGLDQLKDDLSKGKDPQKMRGSVIKMKQEILRLSHLVTNFLNYGKPLKLSKVPVSAGDLIDDSLQMVNDKIADSDITVTKEIETGLRINCDREHMKSCITNIIINALQAMSDGGRLEISAKAASRGKNAVIIVRDTGCGIEENKLKRVGEPFFTTKEGGVGVGLAITKKILAEHDATFTIDSKHGEGTTARMVIERI